MRKNLFIEGVQGSGKSTLLSKLRPFFLEHVFVEEGDLNPLELAWCTYMSKEEYEVALSTFPEYHEQIKSKTRIINNHYVVAYTKIPYAKELFYHYMEQYEIYSGRRKDYFTLIIFNQFSKFKEDGYVFECAFFQNILDELILYQLYTENQIIVFYRELIKHLDLDRFVLLYIENSGIGANIHEIIENRVDKDGNKEWYNLMINYLNDSPYGKKTPFTLEEDLVNYLQKRVNLELRIIDLFLKNRTIIVKSKEYDIFEIQKKINEL